MTETLSGDPTLTLPEFDAPPADPLPLLERWLRDADARGVREPRALALATAAASRQGEALDDPLRLGESAESLAAEDAAPSRPPHWGGWRLDPDLVEFWHGSPDRLHRRLLYVKSDGAWQHRRLQP